MVDEIERTDYGSLSPYDYAEWLDSMNPVDERDYWGKRYQARSEDEKLLSAIIRDAYLKNSREVHSGSSPFVVIFRDSKQVLTAPITSPRGCTILVSRYGLTDWDAALTAALQDLATLLLEEGQWTISWRELVRRLGVSPDPVRFQYREPVGSVAVLKTPYGDLPVIFGKTMLGTVGGAQSGVVIAASRTHVELEDRLGVVHRLRAEEVHPQSGRLDRVVPLTKVVGSLSTVRFGESSLERGGKTFYALEHLSGRRVSVLAADGEKLVVKVDELTDAVRHG